jgi:hypothetical protein
MATNSSEIYDLFLSRCDDYRLTSIYQNSGSATLGLYLEPWLLDSVIEFSPICTQSLEFIVASGSVEGYFVETLTTEHKSILSQILVKYWLAKSIQNILQMNNNITDHDFRMYSQAQNLEAKKKYYIEKKEEISQLINDYSYKNNDWGNWRNMEFDL